MHAVYRGGALPEVRLSPLPWPFERSVRSGGELFTPCPPPSHFLTPPSLLFVFPSCAPLSHFLFDSRSLNLWLSFVFPRALAPPLSLTFAFHLQKNLTLVGISLGCSLSLSPFSFALPLRLLFVFPSRIPRDSPLPLSFPCLTCARFPSLVLILVSPPPRLTIYYVFEYNIIDRSIFIWCVLLIITWYCMNQIINCNVIVWFLCQ